MIALYRIAIFFYKTALHVAALFHDKADQFIKGRVDIFDRLAEAKIAKHKPIWFHCASLGEFEQARSLIDGLHAQGEKILLTFFSPSGYKIRKEYPAADWVFYLPLDSRKNAATFLQYTNPKLAVFVKYDLWYFYLHQLQQHHVPTYLISALYVPNQVYFRPWLGKLHRRMLNMFAHIYLQNKESDELLREVNITHTSVVGDTRVDSVQKRAKEARSFLSVERFLAGQKAIVLGSAYAQEVAILKESLPKLDGEKIIIAPHEINEPNIVKLQKILNHDSIRYSDIDGLKRTDNVLFIDNIGMLFHLYRYAKLVYIGGGHGSGLHNTLEPAAYGVPICFGPKYDNFVEAKEMVNRNCAFVVHSSKELNSVYASLKSDDLYNRVTKTIETYMLESQGASTRILEDILTKID